MDLAYNKSVIIKHESTNKNVRAILWNDLS